MAREINLLIKREGQLTTAQKRQLAQVKKWVPIGLGIFLVILIGVISANIYVTAQQRNLDNQIATTSKAIEGLTQNEGIYMILKQKVAAITQIVNNRYQYLELFNFFKNLEIDNGKLDEISLARDGKTKLLFSVNNSEAMDRVMTAVIDQAKLKFKEVKLVSIRLAENGGYILELDIQV